MSSLINTYSKFYYDIIVDDTNYKLDFAEGAGPELTADINTGEYSLTEIGAEIERALNDTGALTYTVTINRTTRIMTIAASGTFKLYVSTGTHAGISVFTLIGFTGADRTGASSYSGDTAIGSVYEPQFKLQSYVDQEDWQQSADASINKTASGHIEVINFGTEKFFQWNINFITDIEQPCNSPILNNPTGLEDIRDFLRYCIKRTPLEFMPDKSDPSTFYKIILESTPDSQNGTGYKLKELYDKNAPGYFETGVLKWRLLE